MKVIKINLHIKDLANYKDGLISTFQVVSDTFGLWRILSDSHKKISLHVQPEALHFLYSNCSYKTSKSLKPHIVERAES